MLDTEERFWKIGKFAKKLDKHQNTIDNWFKLLEEKRIHFVNRIGKEKVYDEVDLKVAEFIKHRRDRGWAMEAILYELPMQVTVRDTPTTEELMAEDKRFEELELKLKNYIEQLSRNLIETQQKQQLLLEEETRKLREEERAERVNIRLTEITIEHQLRKEAEQKWNELPDEEKYIKGSFIQKMIQGKQIDLEKKQSFINDYIQTRIAQRLKEEFLDKENIDVDINEDKNHTNQSANQSFEIIEYKIK